MASYIIKGNPPEARKRLVTLPLNSIVISVVTQAELLYGLARKGRPAAFSSLIREFLLRVQVLPWDSNTATVYGDLRASCAAYGVMLGALDMLIAAHAIAEKAIPPFLNAPGLKITVQGGIGTANENEFLLEHYLLDGTGWGSPFLLVPEATNVDDGTLKDLAAAKKEDYYLSNASPLGVPFNNFRKSSSEKQRQERIDKGRPGSACYKKLLTSDTEFTAEPICTASRKYQHLKINQLKEKVLPPEVFDMEFKRITEKDCLCEGLGAAVLVKDGVPLSHNLSAVTICPGPNLAYFSDIFSLSEMVGHIYGRLNILNATYRSNMFINELNLYIDYYKKKLEAGIALSAKQAKSLNTFKENLLEGIDYYKNLVTFFKKETAQYISAMKGELDNAAAILANLKVTCS